MVFLVVMAFFAWASEGDNSLFHHCPFIPMELEPEETESPPNVTAIHTVQRGENIWDISRIYGVDVETVLQANGLERKNLLKPGTSLVIPRVKGGFHTVQSGENIWTIAKRYGMKADEILNFNNIYDPKNLKPGMRIFLPGLPVPVTQKCVAKKEAKEDGWSWPVKGGLSSGFGYRQHPMGGGVRFHRGIDISAPSGAVVRAARAGKVIYASWWGLLGRTVIIRHSDGYKTVYAHNSRLLVKPGDTVNAGDPIAHVGSSGLSSGSHLHFEVHYKDRAIDPLKILPHR